MFNFKKSLVALLVLCLIPCIFGCYTYSTGERTGTISKFSQKGLLCKTWEGELIKGATGASGQGNTWAFSVEKSAVSTIELNKNSADFKESYVNLINTGWEIVKNGSTVVLEKSIIDQIKEKQRSGQLATLHYRQELYVASWRAETKYFITKVE